MHHLSCSLPKLIGRILFAILFLLSGVGKLLDPYGMEKLMIMKGVPYPVLLLYLSSAIEIVCGLCLLLGLWTRAAASILFVYLVIVTVVIHPFWKSNPVDEGIQLIEFLKNLAILGGLLYVASSGPGLWSVCGKDVCASSQPKIKRKH